jgi:hypothetical protein
MDRGQHMKRPWPDTRLPCPPWQAHHEAVERARRERTRLVRDGLRIMAQVLKQRICDRFERWNVRLCPLCC